MKRNILKLTVCLAVYLLCSIQTLRAQILTEEMVTEAAAPLVENNVVDGISIGFIHGDSQGTVHLDSSSTKENDEEVKSASSTIYELASVSKVFTSLLLADAVVRGELELDAAVKATNKTNMEFPSHNDRPIRWIDLSTHRSGLPRLPANFGDTTDLKDPYKNYDSKKAAAALAELKLAQTPGETQAYSNFAVSVLGYMVGENAGKSYQELLKERIAKPLGMSDCTVSLSEDQKKRFAVPHSKFNKPTLGWDWAGLPGAGGVHASMDDMMRFAKAQLNPPEGKLGEAIELAWKQHTDAEGTSHAMGLGWMIMADGQTHWHNGQTGGFHTMLLINRKEKLAIVALCNTAVMNEVDMLVFQMMQLATIKGMAEKGMAEAETPQDGNDARASNVSPFTSVGIKNETAFVLYGGKLYSWLEIDDIPVKEIFAASKEHFGENWQKRIREDLVEVLWAMDHKPSKTVKLRLQDFETKKESVIAKARMTKANRRLLVMEQNQVDKAEAKEKEESNVAADDVEIDADLRARLEGRYKLAANFIFDVKDSDGHLMVGITNQPTQEVFPDSSTHWSYQGIQATLEFKLPNKGAAKSLILHQDGAKKTAKRIGK